MNKKKLLIFGAGEAGREVLNSIIKDINKNNVEFNWEVFGFIESNPELIGKLVSGVTVYSLEQILDLNKNIDFYACCPLINTKIRERIVNDEIQALNFKLANLIHPSVIISPTADLADGIILYPNVVIGDNSKISQGAIINYNSVIGHDVVIGKNCFLGPGVILTGRCKIGENVLLGAGTICTPGIEIKANSRISAGIVVTSNINENTTMLLRQSIVKM